MGSHCDSVKNGGNYDGIEGVMTGMEVLETVAAENIPHKHPLTAMIWTNEEGSLYPPAMMVSGIICYDYLPDYLKPNFEYDNMMASKPMDKSEFANFGEALAASKYKGDKANRISPDKYCAMFETHLEQGPILEDNGNEIGAVQLVMGMFNYRVRFHGFTAHAGTFPMAKRHDALHAAADFLCKLHERYDAYNKELVESGESEYEFVFTTGEIYVHPCIHTCIPANTITAACTIQYPLFFHPATHAPAHTIIRSIAMCSIQSTLRNLFASAIVKIIGLVPSTFVSSG
jgi:N-carbamoyl-L-amino-acid hydrolase